jgi:NADH:ubiquinone oxidoreductase subunit F (NADH-binding)
MAAIIAGGRKGAFEDPDNGADASKSLPNLEEPGGARHDNADHSQWDSSLGSNVRSAADEEIIDQALEAAEEGDVFNDEETGGKGIPCSKGGWWVTLCEEKMEEFLYKPTNQ